LKRLLFPALLCGLLAACSEGEPPADVAGYVMRRAGCNHWAGEEGYDAARRAQINREEAALRCSQMDQEEAALMKRYGDRPQILRQIRAAKAALL
jgi:hypothetical protein